MATSIICCAISVLGFLLTYSSLVRKVVTKEDLKDLIDSLNELSDRVVDLEKKTSLLEYRLGKLEQQ